MLLAANCRCCLPRKIYIQLYDILKMKTQFFHSRHKDSIGSEDCGESHFRKMSTFSRGCMYTIVSQVSTLLSLGGGQTYRGKKNGGASPHQSNRNRIIPLPLPISPRAFNRLEKWGCSRGSKGEGLAWHAAYCTKVLSTSKQSLQRSPIGEANFQTLKSSPLSTSPHQPPPPGEGRRKTEEGKKLPSLFSDAFCRRATSPLERKEAGSITPGLRRQIFGWLKMLLRISHLPSWL